jgi:hypothetical protein
MTILEGTCPKCGTHYRGWALSNPLNQSCLKCGSTLEIRKDEGCTLPKVFVANAEDPHFDTEQDVWEDICRNGPLILFSRN